MRLAGAGIPESDDVVVGIDVVAACHERLDRATRPIAVQIKGLQFLKNVCLAVAQEDEFGQMRENIGIAKASQMPDSMC